MSLLPRRNNPAELRAFDEVCQRLGGFEPLLTPEFVDGFLAALAAGPALPEPDAWLPALCDDAFDRAFGDPPARAQALRALKARLAVLADQLDPEALMHEPEDLRLDPLMDEWTDAERLQVQQQEGLTEAEVQGLQTGAVWSTGFLAAVHQLPGLWQPPEVDDEQRQLFEQCLADVEALQLLPGSPEWQQHVQRTYGPTPAGAPDAGQATATGATGATDAHADRAADTTKDATEHAAAPERETLIVDACYAVQALRVWWTDQAPRPQTRRVQPAPGRNDPCPCGSGKKFKKCHGAAA